MSGLGGEGRGAWTLKSSPVMEQDEPSSPHHPIKCLPLSFFFLLGVSSKGTSHQSLAEDCALMIKKKKKYKKDAWMCGFFN